MRTESQILKIDWKHKLEQWLSSGLSQKRWCEEQGIAKHTFNYWRTKLLPSHKTLKENPNKFVELVDVGSFAAGISIEYRGITIHLSKGFHSASLISCLQTLQGF